MRYVWNDTLETGNQVIDNQHHQLFEALNSLVDAYTAGEGEAELIRILEFLNDYVVKHFADEERMMTRSRYPDFDVHRQYHEAFKNAVRQYAQRLEQEGATETLMVEVEYSVANWLQNHIKGDDFRLAGHLQRFGND